MEEFRPIIVDTLTLSLFNLKILQTHDFLLKKSETAEQTPGRDHNDMPDVNSDPIGMMSIDEKDAENFDLPEQRIEASPVKVEPVTGKYPVRLKPDAFKKVIAAFEKKLTASFYYPPAERIITYQDAIIFQAAHYRKVIEGEAQLYQPLTLK